MNFDRRINTDIERKVAADLGGLRMFTRYLNESRIAQLFYFLIHRIRKKSIARF